MFFQEPVADGTEVVVPPALTSAALGLAVVATVLLGVVPGALLEVAGSSDMLFVR
jgi:NADH-quinone oxidoreductase subunit N